MKRIISLLMLTAMAALAATSQSKIAPDLLNLDPQTNVPVIVQWKSAPTSSQNSVVTLLGGILGPVLHLLNAVLYTVPVSSLNSLAANPNVVYISPDRPVAARLDNTAAAVNAHVAWSAGLNGSGIGVAVIDSGITANSNLGTHGVKQVVYSYDFTAPNAPNLISTALGTVTSLLSNLTNLLFNSGTSSNQLPSTYAPDQFGHGEHVAGILASNAQASTCSNCTRTLKGISPGVNLIDLKVLDQNGQGTDSNVILAIQTAITLKSVYNIRVINLSLGRPVIESYTQDPLCQAVEAAWKAGIVVVVAAGNDGRDNTFGEQGYGTINAPGNDPYVITVGAMKTQGTPTRIDDTVASYSSKGPTQVDHVAKPDLVAPGNLVVSLLQPGSTLQQENPANDVPVSYYQNVTGSSSSAISNTYFMLSGTSMATPVVSGAAALLLQANSKLTPDQVKAIMMQTAYKTFPQSSSVFDPTTGNTYTDYYDIFTVGAGYLDIAAALSAVRNPPASGAALSPIVTYDATSGTATVNLDPTSIWALQSVLSTRSVWGAQTVWGAGVLDSATAVYGARKACGERPMSPARAVSGARKACGEHSRCLRFAQCLGSEHRFRL